MALRYLTKEDGSPFSDAELEEVAHELEALSNAERTAFREENAAAIANNPATALLIISGPGTGKSWLFKQRIHYWLERSPDSRILVLSFVRKLVADLSNDIEQDATLAGKASNVAVHTLHKYARSIVEQNRGTVEWRFQPHLRIIGGEWQEIVWGDVLVLRDRWGDLRYSWKLFEKQLHDLRFEESAEWKELRETYFLLCRFYNAAGFADLILRAKDALAENAALNKYDFFIFDEYQDFNAAEEALLEELTRRSKGVLLAGDDDQVLYETLKSGNAALIRSIYGNATVLKAMLPLCSRCGFHITRAASHFIRAIADPSRINKVYEPLVLDPDAPKVGVVACATPATAVDFIARFIEEHRDEIEQRRAELAAGKGKDPFLLILSPTRDAGFLKPNGAQERLIELVNSFREPGSEFSDDYYKVITYYSLAAYSENNFTFRKVLYYEESDEREVGSLLQNCLARNVPLSRVDVDIVRNALSTAIAIRKIMDADDSIDEKITAIAEHVDIMDSNQLRVDLERKKINDAQAEALEHQDEEQVELEELEIKPMAAVELMTIVGSKGLSADHVIIVGFDDVNMTWVTANAFYVAITRARTSLNLITALKAGGANQPHEFLARLPEAHLECSKYTKSKGEQEGIGGGVRGLTEYIERLSSVSRRRP